jgi:hypothetical protein
VNTVEFRDIMLVTTGTAVSLSTTGSNAGVMLFNNVFFGDNAGIATSFLSCGSICTFNIRMNNCRVATSTQTFSSPLFNINGSAFLSCLNCDMTTSSAVPIIQLGGTSYCVLGLNQFTNSNLTTASANGIVFLNSLPPSTVTNSIGRNSFTAFTAGATGTPAICVTLNGQNVILDTNLIGVRTGAAPSTHCIIAGTGSTTTTIYYSTNYALPTTATAIQTGGGLVTTALAVIN